jgi:DNA uptake protein ComE-like DNA-binding protein
MMVAALVAAPAVAAPTPSGGPAPVDGRASLPTAHVPGAPLSTAAGPQQRPAPVQYYVDLNSASRKELMTLPGIGASEASRIIAKRPYLVKTELVTKDVLPIGPFVSLKHLVVAMPATAPQGKH